ncbi:multicopper oxidase domain-containing protein [Nitrosococcus wardiae]|uniref:Copper oxidase n=1 Tax=Nitrosococcus wardiae TaxID=1814290 RepID=A0A4P7C145_9GAMM|nr:multicopper oxidase domain-containing protein [Nitrosococcus wardiae]QBQ55154.1 copper oxidase [Nitrosococcus wardiae]
MHNNLCAEFPANVSHSQYAPPAMGKVRWMILPLLAFALSFSLFGKSAFANSAGKLHVIEMWAEKIESSEGGDDLFAYRMASHVIFEMDESNSNPIDVTSRYAGTATIPGPTIIINEGDEVELTLHHGFDPGDSAKLNQVSVHVHGVHYDILSDGTLEYINLVTDEGATAIPVMSYTYHWVAAPGTAGTWPYHDHNMITLNGAEDRGLYGALIVNDQANIVTVSQGNRAHSAAFSSLEKEYVLFLGDDAFWGTEIDSQTGQQIPLWVNPDLSVQQGSNVRFHLIALGTNTHQFKFPGYKWVDPGTNLIITEKALGPLEKHVFSIQANHSSVYRDQTFSSKLLGMKGHFKAIP